MDIQPSIQLVTVSRNHSLLNEVESFENWHLRCQFQLLSLVESLGAFTIFDKRIRLDFIRCYFSIVDNFRPIRVIEDLERFWFTFDLKTKLDFDKKGDKLE